MVNYLATSPYRTPRTRATSSCVVCPACNARSAAVQIVARPESAARASSVCVSARRQHRLPQRFIQQHQLRQQHSAMISGSQTLLATGGQPAIVGLLSAIGAEAAQEPLVENPLDAAGEQVGFDAHFEQPADDAATAAGVQGAEDEMAGEGGLDDDVGGVGVAHFADHDDLGILPEQAASPRAKSNSVPGLACAWLIPSSTCSTGSSMVTMWRVPWLMRCRWRRQA